MASKIKASDLLTFKLYISKSRILPKKLSDISFTINDKANIKIVIDSNKYEPKFKKFVIRENIKNLKIAELSLFGDFFVSLIFKKFDIWFEITFEVDDIEQKKIIKEAINIIDRKQNRTYNNYMSEQTFNYFHMGTIKRLDIFYIITSERNNYKPFIILLEKNKFSEDYTGESLLVFKPAAGMENDKDFSFVVYGMLYDYTGKVINRVPGKSKNPN